MNWMLDVDVCFCFQLQNDDEPYNNQVTSASNRPVTPPYDPRQNGAAVVRHGRNGNAMMEMAWRGMIGWFVRVR